MKCLTALIRPFKITETQDALRKVGVTGLTVSEVKGSGGQTGHTDIYRGAEYTASFIPKLRIDVVVPDDQVEKAIDAIMSVARTGEHGDGKIFVFTMDTVVRIRTGERGEAAVQPSPRPTHK